MTLFNTKLSNSTVPWAETAGVQTLQRMAAMDRYNRWIAERLAPYIGQRVLEVGCGIGTMTPFWLQAEQLTCIDVLPESVAAVQTVIAHHPHARALVADISDPATVEQVGAATFDTVICINVLEHIADDLAALRHMYTALIPGGYLLLFVPAGQYLYGRLDEALGHYRRYTCAELRAKVEGQGFTIAEASYMNAAGIAGWFVSSRLLRRTTPPRELLGLFNRLTPAFRAVEEQVHLPIGQSLVCVAQRPLQHP